MPRRKKSCLARKEKYYYKKKDQTTIPCPAANLTTANNCLEKEKNSVANWSLAMKNFYLDPNFSEDKIADCVNDNQLIDSDGDSANEFYVILDKAYEYNPEDNLDEFVKKIYLEKFCNLTIDVKSQRFDEFTLVPNEDSLKFVNFYHGDLIHVKTCVVINAYLHASIQVHHSILPQDNPFWTGLPNKYKSVTDIHKLLTKIQNSNICVGNHESELLKGKLSTEFNSVTAYMENDNGAYVGNVNYTSTIRSNKCELLRPIFVSGFSGLRCKNCCSYRNTLRKSRSRSKVVQNTEITLSSKKSHADMTKKELVMKVDSLKGQSAELKAQNEKLRKTIFNKIKSSRIELNSTDNSELLKMLESGQLEIETTFSDENSLQRVFWDQDVEYVLTSRINQDPLEEQFSHLRHKGVSSDNSSVYDVKSTTLSPIHGNITGARKSTGIAGTVDCRPPAKRPKNT